jgi:hypothetical protein
VDVEIEVRNPASDRETSFGDLWFSHRDCGSARMHIHRNPITSEYMLRCACGLKIRLPQMGEASKQIVCAVIDGVARDLPAGSFTSELAKAVRVFPRDAA